MAHPNEELLRQGYEAFAAGGQATEFWAFLEDDYAADRFFG
ncbi:MAG TPA: hypothetical protein VMI33_13025 [Streptosporangiaceae bacterium]|nr:hypothetical protein [Streptosporangiaceae bacterium]